MYVYNHTDILYKDEFEKVLYSICFVPFGYPYTKHIDETELNYLHMHKYIYDNSCINQLQDNDDIFKKT